MKIVARLLVEDRKVALDCKPLFGDQFTVYLSRVDGHWMLPSGRPATKPMLAALDRLSGLSLKRRG